MDGKLQIIGNWNYINEENSMNSAQMRNAYRQTEAQAKIHPVKLIHMMYERTLVHLEKAREGCKKNDPRLRGENLGKSIAIITELNASVKEDDNSEAASFLRGLYGAILTELPKASVSGDGQIVKQAYAYIQRLKDIWEDTAMVEAGQHVGIKSEDHRENMDKVADAAFIKDHTEKPSVPGGLSVSI